MPGFKISLNVLQYNIITFRQRLAVLENSAFKF